MAAICMAAPSMAQESNDGAQASQELRFDASTGDQDQATLNQYLAMKYGANPPQSTGDVQADGPSQMSTWTDAGAAGNGADIVMTGGGTGTNSQAYQFNLSNINHR